VALQALEKGAYQSLRRAGVAIPGELAAPQNSGALARARGEPFAFGNGTRSVRAEQIIQEAAQASGHPNYAGLVDRVVYDAQATSPSFWVNPNTGERIITIDATTFGKMRAGQLVAGTHELVHAEQWVQELARQGGNLGAAHPSFFGTSRLQYAIDEVLAERAALQRASSQLGGVTPQQVGHSTRYIEFWQREIVRLGGTPVP
jgi:hypothetical protein